ncbi:MAG: nucleoside-diphosphate kinase [Limisphaerales bacterium]
MAEELAYAIITPYSLHKSRTGGIIARLISRTGLELVAARMFAPSSELALEYAQVLVSSTNPQDRRIQELIQEYVRANITPDPRTDRRRRVMLLLFRGEDAVHRIRSVIGNFSPHRRSGETIRDTYGDLVMDENDTVRYFEPAVLCAPTAAEAVVKLRLWARHSDADGGILEDVGTYGPEEKPERTLVLLKPDNFRFASGRPGNMIDFFSRTNLLIVGIKVHRMSVAEAMEFYGPVREVLRTKLNDVVAGKARVAIEKELGFPIPTETERQLGPILGPVFGDNQFDNIIRFMAGRSPSECEPSAMTQPGSEKSIALLYEGVNAVVKIRDVLGPTDPNKAPAGSIRREFGLNIMVNAAHASDSADNARRELKIVNVGDNQFKHLVEEMHGLC